MLGDSETKVRPFAAAIEEEKRSTNPKSTPSKSCLRYEQELSSAGEDQQFLEAVCFDIKEANYEGNPYAKYF